MLSAENPELEVVITADDSYSYGFFHYIDVLLDGKWYAVPFMHDGFLLLGLEVNPDTKLEDRTHVYSPVFRCGILPAGRYRIVKAFGLYGDFSNMEFAIAEFTVAETLDWFVLQPRSG